MIQIDDAGSGSLIGGTCIGAMRVETGEFYYEILPIELYSKNAFRKKLYLDYVIEIVQRCFKELEVGGDEKIEVCRGYMFDKLRKWFKNENYNYESVTITDPLQTKIEDTFEKYTISLGLPKDYIRYTKYPFHFHTLLKWVYSDYENRTKLCKTGWKSWAKYGNLKTEISYDIIEKSNYLCLKCGKPIEDNSKVRIIKYTSNREATIYVHSSCTVESLQGETDTKCKEAK
ncbi:hypothetical protein [Sporosalibacterium faouarense]|uniref:hypothetical protein n=1 Tax=Sporosalibacterium faouarense TaxID=516123 RepID=UPI00141D70A7|nr:hypothetical protein [Sporosalibacterium faouarense]MTI48156.1 hypothetical protein [Bacillota bacterium]